MSDTPCFRTIKPTKSLVLDNVKQGDLVLPGPRSNPGICLITFVNYNSVEMWDLTNHQKFEQIGLHIVDDEIGWVDHMDDTFTPFPGVHKVLLPL